MVDLEPTSTSTNRSAESTPAARRRVLFVSSTPHQGGIERVSIRLAAELVKAGDIDCAFACRPESFTQDACEREGVRVVPYVTRNSGDLLGVWRLARQIGRLRPDILHVHSRRDYLPAVLAVGLARRLGARSRLFFHCHMVRSLGEPENWSGAFFGRRVDRFLAVSEAVRTDLLRRHPALPQDRVVVLPNGVDVAHIRRAGEEQRREIRARWRIPETAIVIGMVGRLDAKGQAYVVQVARELQKAIEPDVRLLFVGGEGPAGYEKELREIARGCGIGHEMILTGVQEDVAPYLAAMDIFAHLPRDEAFGLAIAEAMAAQLPVVASQAPGCREVVADRESGYQVDIDQPAQITEAIVELARSAELRRRIGAAGYARVQERYSLESQLRQLTALYEDAARKP